MRPVLVLVAAVALAIVAGCNALGGPRVVTVPTTELSTRLADRFPLDQRLLEVIDVRLLEPRLSMLPELNRLRADFRLQVRERLSGRELDTRLSIESALRWEPSDRSVRLERVEIDRIDAADAGDRDRPLLLRLATLLLSSQFEGMPLVRLPQRQSALVDDSGLAVTRLRVTAAGLELTLALAP